MTPVKKKMKKEVREEDGGEKNDISKEEERKRESEKEKERQREREEEEERIIL